MTPQYAVRLQRNVRIPMPDGVSLAADLYLPDAPGRFPVVFDYYPYRKNDSAPSGYAGHRYFASCGIAAGRVDVRGTGDSAGVIRDELTLPEQLDGVAVVAWLAEQPWSSGRVGMFGGSYGGQNTMLVAAQRPPALGAIIPMFFSDRPFVEEGHYHYGALQMLFNTGLYGLAMAMRGILPPRPDLVGASWEAMWRPRLEADPWLLEWLSHPTEDAYWRRPSFDDRYAEIACPTFLIGGWRDGNVNGVLRAFERLSVPRRLLMGPWLHTPPNHGLPAPRLDTFREMARFFATYLADRDVGLAAEPAVRFHLQSYDPPSMTRTFTSGSWRGAHRWPPASTRMQAWHLASGGRLSREADASEVTDALVYDPSVGTRSALYSVGTPNYLPDDQREDDARSACFGSEPLEARLDVVGRPRARIVFSSSAERLCWVVRLLDVAPDGRSALVCKGRLNAAYRESFTAPSALPPGVRCALEVELDATAWSFAPGHRLRLALAHADFPNLWPTADAATTQLYRGGAVGTQLLLPVLHDCGALVELPSQAELPLRGATTAPAAAWRVIREPIEGRVTVETAGHKRAELDAGVIHETRAQARASVREASPAHATVTGSQHWSCQWPSLHLEARGNSTLESNARSFELALELELAIDGQARHQRTWRRSYPRHWL